VNRSFQFHKRSQLFLPMHNETLSVVATGPFVETPRQTSLGVLTDILFRCVKHFAPSRPSFRVALALAVNGFHWSGGASLQRCSGIFFMGLVPLGGEQPGRRSPCNSPFRAITTNPKELNHERSKTRDLSG
jgi:hypothetical protein